MTNTPLKPCPDAVEALKIAIDTALVMRPPHELVTATIVQVLNNSGFTITRQPAMTDAELEKEACYLHTRAQHGFDTVDEIMALAKKWRG